MHRKLWTLIVFVCLTSTSHAQISWLGAVSDDIFDEGNWDLAGSAVSLIDPNVSIADDVVIGAGPFEFNPIIPQVDGQQRFQLEDGHALTVSGTLDIAGNDGVGGAPGTTNGPSVHVVDGGAFNPFFVVNDVTVNIDANSSATFGGGGNPINLSTLQLVPGATVSFLAETPDQYRAEHLSKTFVAGELGVEGINLSIVGDGANGSIVTAVPEPSAMFLTILGTISLLSLTRPQRIDFLDDASAPGSQEVDRAG